MTTILELSQSIPEKGKILPSLKEAWKEYSILALILGGGFGIGASAVVLVGTGAAIAGLTSGVALGVGAAWGIRETIHSND